MNEWVEAEKQLPDKNQKVLIMLQDASGFNAIYQDGKFVLERDPAVFWLPKDVKYWKSRSGFENFQDQVKKRCGMCGRFR